MKLYIKKQFKNIFMTLRGHEILRELNKYPKILIWHGVDHVKHPNVEPENVDVDVFVEQIKYLKKHFEIISMTDFENHFLNHTLKKNQIVLTFDDGYRNNLTVLAPIMKDFKLPFTTFISTSNIDTGDFFITSLIRILTFGSKVKTIDIPSAGIKTDIKNHENKILAQSRISNFVKKAKLPDVKNVHKEIISNFSDGEFEELREKYSSLLPLSWEETKKLSSSGCVIGSHCLDHICCHSNQSKEEVEKQILTSKKIIENKLNIECKYFAYPNGDFTDYSNECVKKAGYTLGFSTQKKRLGLENEQKESLPRFITQNNLDTFKILLNYYRGK